MIPDSGTEDPARNNHTEHTAQTTEKIILFPDFEILREEVEKLRVELSMLVLELDHIRLVECKNIEMRYLLAVGGEEYRAYEAYSLFLRLKRKLALIQSRLNRQEKIIADEIEKILDREFAAFQDELNRRIGRMNAAIDLERNGRVLNEEETAELKKLYRRIVKALHPDLHPDVSPEQLSLFYRAVDAYECGDLDTLRAIDTLTGSPIAPDIRENSIETLLREKKRLSGLIEDVRRKTEKVMSEYPYTLKELVLDETALAEKRMELTEITRDYEQAAKLLQERITQILAEQKAGETHDE